ncbi:hypothetical protein [Bacillus sp. N1-1]|uniref:hypothetical protein n=1 Tax=Bacillus sp. N1-1 TaxID=2682541 RepID=UPI001317992F|nr:hypothetical protein [Bacillus sp. N1-1]QHA91264.1 hypothetical protein GNK04_07440 [Bacillus sp. N1-1]
MGKPIVSDNEALAYLRMTTPKENQNSIFFMVLFFVDIIGFFPYLVGPFSLTFFLAALLPGMAINVWMLVYVLTPYKLEGSYDLLLGCLSIVCSYLYWLGIEKFIYVNLGAEGNSFFWIGLFILIFLTTFFYFFTRYYVKKGKYKRKRTDRQHLSGFEIVISAAIVIGMPQLLDSMSFFKVQNAYLLIVLLGFMSIITLFLIGSFHKYHFIKNNQDLVRKAFTNYQVLKKERKAVKEDYSVAVIKEGNLTHEEMKVLTDELGEFSNVSSVKKVTSLKLDQEDFHNEENCKPFCLVVMNVEQGQIDKEIKKMVRIKRWKYFFIGIPEEEYEKVEDRVLFDPRNAVFQSGDIADVRGFLLNEMR